MENDFRWILGVSSFIHIIVGIVLAGRNIQEEYRRGSEDNAIGLTIVEILRIIFTVMVITYLIIYVPARY